MDLFNISGICYLSREEFLIKLANAELSENETKQLDVEFVSIDDKFIDNQSIILKIENILFNVNAHGSILPLEIIEVEGVIYGLHCSNCQEYGYNSNNIPYFPHLYHQKNLFKRIIDIFPNSKSTVLENQITHEKRYRIIFDLKNEVI